MKGGASGRRQRWYPSRWGPEDEAGALNLVTATKITSAAMLVSRGKVYELSHVLEMGIPVHWINGQFHYSTFRNHAEISRQVSSKNKFAAMSVRIEVGDHTGTHLDGLNHVSKDMKLYNGVDAFAATGPHGTTKNGMEKTPPIFTRGVLADLAGFKGVKRLDGGQVVTEKELRGCLKKAGVTIKPGDALLMATGWGQHWMTDNEKFLGACPGIGMEAAEWIVEQGASLVGSDTWKVEVHPGEVDGIVTPVHQFMIAEHGIRLLENLDLEAIRKDGISEFLFVCLPLRVRGGAGSPVSPIAVV